MRYWVERFRSELPPNVVRPVSRPREGLSRFVAQNGGWKVTSTVLSMAGIVMTQTLGSGSESQF